MDSPNQRTPKVKPVTYQLTLRARDGIVLASDQREFTLAQDLETGIENNFPKITMSGCFAWAHWGGPKGPTCSAIIASAIRDLVSTDDEQMRRFLTRCIEQTLKSCEENGTGAGNKQSSHVVFACGNTKRVYKITIQNPPLIEEFGPSKPCITGLSANQASFIVNHLYSEEMSVDQLSVLAAYSILEAGALEPKYVGGLDVAVYRDVTEGIGKWELLPLQKMKEAASALDDRIRAVFRSGIDRAMIGL
jgi:hypothetical protein